MIDALTIAVIVLVSALNPVSPWGNDPPKAAESPFRSIGQLDWSAGRKGPDSVTSSKKEEVEKFILDELGAKPNQEFVCSYDFVATGAAKPYTLVASMDASGRHFCNEVVIVAKSGDRFGIQRLQAWEVDDITRAVQDIKGNGTEQLVLPTPYSPYDGAKCIATWTKVYDFDDKSVTDRSASYKDFYLHRLKELRTQVGSSESSDRTCVQMEVDKLERYLGNNSSAGERTAMQWLTSPDRSLRLKAIAVLADIRDESSIASLQQLSQDKDALISEASKTALLSVPKK